MISNHLHYLNLLKELKIERESKLFDAMIEITWHSLLYFVEDLKENNLPIEEDFANELIDYYIEIYLPYIIESGKKRLF